ncbi:hypothetical protein V6N12_013124 [Hibiscus sabdariffa]|uniref:Uncharacterized protein n=1 Tax=Hibiscus sabdariffa TaxID=183260 RepID=A0ABR1ZHK3_9ROSI
MNGEQTYGGRTVAEEGHRMGHTWVDSTVQMPSRSDDFTLTTWHNLVSPRDSTVTAVDSQARGSSNCHHARAG